MNYGYMIYGLEAGRVRWLVANPASLRLRTCRRTRPHTVFSSLPVPRVRPQVKQFIQDGGFPKTTPRAFQIFFVLKRWVTLYPDKKNSIRGGFPICLNKLCVEKNPKADDRLLQTPRMLLQKKDKSNNLFAVPQKLAVPLRLFYQIILHRDF